MSNDKPGQTINGTFARSFCKLVNVTKKKCGPREMRAAMIASWYITHFYYKEFAARLHRIVYPGRGLFETTIGGMGQWARIITLLKGLY